MRLPSDTDDMIASIHAHEPKWPQKWRRAESSDLAPLGASSCDLSKFCRRNGLKIHVAREHETSRGVIKSLKVVIDAENDGTCWKHLFRFFGDYEQLLVQGSPGTKVEISVQLLMRLTSEMKAVEIDKETVMVRLEMGLPYPFLSSLNFSFLSLSIVPTARFLIQALLFNLPNTLRTLEFDGMAEMYAEDLSNLPPHLARLNLSSVIEIHHSIALCLPNNLRLLQLPRLVATREIFFLMPDGYDVTELESSLKGNDKSEPFTLSDSLYLHSCNSTDMKHPDTSSTRSPARPSFHEAQAAEITESSNRSTFAPSLSKNHSQNSSSHHNTFNDYARATDFDTMPQQGALKANEKEGDSLTDSRYSEEDRSTQLLRSIIKGLPRRTSSLRRTFDSEESPSKLAGQNRLLTVVIGQYWRINAESLTTPNPIPQLCDLPRWRDASRKRPPWLRLPQNPLHSCAFLPWFRSSSAPRPKKRNTSSQKALMARSERESLLKNVPAYLLLVPRNTSQIDPSRYLCDDSNAPKPLNPQERMAIPHRYSCFSNPGFEILGPNGEVWWRKGFECVGARRNKRYTDRFH